MKQITGWSLFSILTFAAVYWGVVWSANWNRNIEYDGTNIEFQASTERYIDISAPSTLSAASDGFFVLRNEAGTQIVAGMPATPPLDSYFAAGPVQVSGGRWIVEKDNPKVILQANTPIRVVTVETESDASANDLLVGVLCFVVWIVAAAIGSSIWEKI